MVVYHVIIMPVITYILETSFFYKRATMQLDVRVEKSFAQIYPRYGQLFVVEQRVRSQ